MVVPTMQMIAEAAGCSRMTVSLALRKSPRISAATRKRVEQTAAKLGYRPNPLIASLMAQRGRSSASAEAMPLAVIHRYDDFAWFTGSPFYAGLLRGIEERAYALGFSPVRFDLSPSSQRTPARLDRILWTRNIHGIIILPLPPGGEPFSLAWEHYSTSTHGYTWSGVPLHRSSDDQFANCRLLLTSLYQAGYRRPALILPRITEERTAGHHTAALYHFQNHTPGVIAIPPFFVENDWDTPAINRWLRKHQPDVVIGHGNFTSSLRAAGWEVPENFGYADLNLAPNEKGHISGIDSLPDLLGEAAVDLVVSRLHRNELGLPVHARTAMVRGEWSQGTTTRAPVEI